MGGMRGGVPFGAGGMGRPEEEDVELEVLVTVEEALEGVKKRLNYRQGGAVETLEVKIPKGVREGQRIRLAGKGRHGGDLLLKIALAPHAFYRVENADLVRSVEVAPWDAVLGCEVEVGTPEGGVKLKVPAGTQPGRRFRLRGRGLTGGDKERGDFFVEVKVVLPVELSEAQRGHWEALAGMGRR